MVSLPLDRVKKLLTSDLDGFPVAPASYVNKAIDYWSRRPAYPISGPSIFNENQAVATSNFLGQNYGGR